MKGADLFALTFLGTGTSVGVPMIGCDCPVCTSSDPRNRRTRSSLYIRAGTAAFVIDTPPDFREQALKNQLTQLDAVIFTHAHADHVFGFDDVRRFNSLQDNRPIPAFAVPETLAEIRRIFSYIDVTAKKGLFRPLIQFTSVTRPFVVGDALLTPIAVEHDCTTHGFRIDFAGRSVGYVPDCKHMTDLEVDRLKGVDIMILDALRYKPHPTHLCVAESLALLKRIGATRNYLVHLCHDLDHATLESELPDNVRVAYDSLTLTLDIGSPS